jgi:hypothetical protein
MDTRPEPKDIEENESPKNTEKLLPKGIRAVQGMEKPENSDPSSSAEIPNSIELETDAQTNEMLEEWQRTHDPANWEYKFGSPHKEYQLAKDLQKAQRQHELGRQAMTADSLGDVIDTTLQAHREAGQDEETPMDQYFREKYGTQPYTTEAYPKDQEENE